MADADPAVLQAGESVLDGFRRRCDRRFDRAIDLIRNPTLDRAEDIHLVRTSIKEIRALLRLLRPQIRDAVFRREDARLRSIAQRLSATRDVTAGRQALTRLLKGAASRRDRQTLLLVLDCYARWAGDREPECPQAVLAAVGRALRTARSHLRKLHFAATGWEAIAPGLQGVYHDCRARSKKAYDRERNHDFHRWRIRVKNLYYELLWLEAAWPRRLKKMSAHLKILQDKLGGDHDLTVLEDVLRRSPEKFGGVHAVERVLRRIEKRRQRLRRDSRRLSRKIFKVRTDIFVRRLGRHWLRWRNGGD